MSSEKAKVTYIGPMPTVTVLGVGEFKKDIPRVIEKEKAAKLKVVKGFKIEDYREEVKKTESPDSSLADQNSEKNTDVTPEPEDTREAEDKKKRSKK